MNRVTAAALILLSTVVQPAFGVDPTELHIIEASDGYLGELYTWDYYLPPHSCVIPERTMWPAGASLPLWNGKFTAESGGYWIEWPGPVYPVSLLASVGGERVTLSGDESWHEERGDYYVFWIRVFNDWSGDRIHYRKLKSGGRSGTYTLVPLATAIAAGYPISNNMYEPCGGFPSSLTIREKGGDNDPGECNSPPKSPDRKSAKDCPSPPASTGAPILLEQGAVFESATDLALPGKTIGWSHSRNYNSQHAKATATRLAAISGEKWETGEMSRFIRKVDVDSDMDDDIVLYYDTTSRREFLNDGMGAFAPAGDFRATLVYEANGGNPDEYVLTMVDSGERFIFHGFDVSADKQGMLKQKTDRYGVETITYTYNDNAWRIQSVASSQGWVIDYTYIWDNANFGRIKQIDVKNGSGQVIQRAKYTYYTSGQGYSTDLGSAGVETGPLDLGFDTWKPSRCCRRK